MIVKSYAHRFRWAKHPKNIWREFTDRCSIQERFCGDYRTITDTDSEGYSDINERILKAWEDAGFHAAISLKEQPIQRDVDSHVIDDIPF